MKGAAAGLALAALLVACGSSDAGSSPSGPVLVPAKGPMDPAAAPRAAALVASCIPDDNANSVLDHIYGYHGALDYARDATTCLATKTNGCQGVTECTGITVDTTAGCKAGCDGDRITTCDGDVRFRADCARFGKTCEAPTAGPPSCVEPGAATCNTSSFAQVCDGDRPVYCSGGFREHGPSCSAYGADCGTVPGDNQFVCHGRGDPCSSPIGPGEVQYVGLGCSGGSSLRACLNGTTTDVDCGTFGAGFTCQTTYDNVSFCGQGTECKPGTTRATCDGTKIVLCNGGKKQPIDCTTLGFTTCSDGRCTP